MSSLNPHKGTYVQAEHWTYGDITYYKPKKRRASVYDAVAGMRASFEIPPLLFFLAI